MAPFVSGGALVLCESGIPLCDVALDKGLRREPDTLVAQLHVREDATGFGFQMGAFAGPLVALLLHGRTTSEEEFSGVVALGVLVGMTAGSLIASRFNAWLPVFPCGRQRVCYDFEPTVERVHHGTPPHQLTSLIVITAERSRTDLQIAAAVRRRLVDSGFAILPRKTAERGTSPSAVATACDTTSTPHIDGVVVTTFNRLELYDCSTRAMAYEIDTPRGIVHMTTQLIAYLRRGRTTTPAPQ